MSKPNNSTPQTAHGQITLKRGATIETATQWDDRRREGPWTSRPVEFTTDITAFGAAPTNPSERPAILVDLSQPPALLHFFSRTRHCVRCVVTPDAWKQSNAGYSGAGFSDGSVD